MNLSSEFIKRPIATTLMMVAVVALGIVIYRLLPVAALPSIDSPTIQVTAQMPGADPQTMASSVATQLERQFGQIPGLSQMTSSSGTGFTEITLQFDRSGLSIRQPQTCRRRSTPHRRNCRVRS